MQTNARWWDRYLAALALIGAMALLLAPPAGLLDKADHAAYAVCARLPGHVFVVAGRPLPLCARCSGTYLAALAGLAALTLAGRTRAGGLPGRRYIALFALFVLAWAVDGLNSYVSFFTDLPHLYEPANLLRLATGALEGLALAAFLLPILNLSLWAAPSPAASVGSWRDLVALLAGGAVVVGLVGSEWPPLLYPLALFSGAAVIALIAAVNLMIVLILLRREGQATRWRELLAPLAVALVLALVELWAIAAARAFLTARLGLPF
ncbi:MAG: DUF2085 domain-containing protein [Chloroflexi bacterium]|nr:DUF2085 domain-containing protein [Chloroflexota bacterium]